VSHPKFRCLLILLLVLGSSVASLGNPPQQGQEPSATPPPQPPPGAANGPHPGPAVRNPEHERTSQATPNATPAPATETMRNFLAIGAPPDPEAVKRGQALFVATCGFCHGSNANGGATGPDLVRSVLVLHDQGTAKEIGPVVRNGRPAKGMPSFNLSEPQIKDIAAFLLSRTQAAANRMEYKILNIVSGDAKAGETYFNAHCAECHSPSGDLAHVGTKFEPVALQSRFLYPKRQSWGDPEESTTDPGEEKTVTVKLASGQTYSGKLDRIDDFSVSLTETSGEHRSWLFDAERGINVEVHDPLKAHADLLKQYTDADMHNILAYLETLK
jgi:cytochrome c oxidase cbb3-type subunit III